MIGSPRRGGKGSIRSGRRISGRTDMSHHAVTAALLASLWISSSASAAGTEPSKISLPAGPGSIEGLGRDFVPSLSSGGASYGVDIAVPPAAGGFGPKLTLEYDSGGGVTELGIGWRIGGLPNIRRRTVDGLPQFDAGDALELTGFGATSDLVELSPGIFRPQLEFGAFVRIQRGEN